MNICRDEDYLKNLYVQALNGKQRMVKRALATESQLFAKFHQDPAFCRARTEELENLKPQGYKALTVRKRFELAGFEAEYDGIYALLCTETHNDLTAIEDRHLEMAEDGKSLTVTFLQPLESDKVASLLYLLANVTLDSSIQTHNLLESERVGVIEEIKRQYKRLT